jgi:hypothetical protein
VSNVPSHTRTRRTHRHGQASDGGARRSHQHSGYLPAIEGSAEVYEQISVDEAGQVTAGGLSPGAVTAAAFASTIAPVVLVHGLPTLPDPRYPIDTFAYDIDAVPKSMWKNVADVWTRAIGPADIQADSITAGQIAAGAISTSELAAQSVHIGHMMGSPSNLCPNPSFEQLGTIPINTDSGDVPGWIVPVGAQVSNAVAGHGGANSLKFTQANPVAQIIATTDFVPIVAGRRYVVSLWVRGSAGNAGNAKTSYRVRFFDAAFVQLSNAALASTTPGTSTVWTRSSAITAAADATAVYAKVVVFGDTGSAIGDISYVDDVELYPADYDVSHAGGDVSIDSTGITIRNGKLVLEDEFALTSMVASGFSGSWRDFLGSGLYNNAFKAGINGSLPLARGANLPYWTVARDNVGTGTPDFLNDGGATLTRAVDTNMPAGFRVRMAWSGINDNAYLISDPVAVVVGSNYYVRFTAGANRSAGTLGLTVYLRWLDEDLAQLSLQQSNTRLWTSTTAPDEYVFAGSIAGANRAPANARFVQVILQGWEDAHNASNSIDVGSVACGRGASTGEYDPEGIVGGAAGVFTGQGDPLGGSLVLSAAGNVSITGEISHQGLLVTGGTVFPGSPVADDLYYRTDRGEWFRYDGTRWRCAINHEYAVPAGLRAHLPLSATVASDSISAVPSLEGGSDIWLIGVDFRFQVASGGTALSGSHKWVATFKKGVDGSATETTIATVNVDSGSSGVWRAIDTAIGALMNSGTTHRVFTGTLTRTGTPGDLYYGWLVKYNHVAT